MKLKSYACALSAGMSVFGINCRAYAVWTTSKEKAKDIAFAEALRLWPTEKGYRFHKVDIAIVPPPA